jgi:hypothetical protein
MVEWRGNAKARRGRGAKAIGKKMDGKKMNKAVAPLETVETVYGVVEWLRHLAEARC